MKPRIPRHISSDDPSPHRTYRGGSRCSDGIWLRSRGSWVHVTTRESPGPTASGWASTTPRWLSKSQVGTFENRVRAPVLLERDADRATQHVHVPGRGPDHHGSRHGPDAGLRRAGARSRGVSAAEQLEACDGAALGRPESMHHVDQGVVAVAQHTGLSREARQLDRCRHQIGLQLLQVGPGCGHLRNTWVESVPPPLSRL